MLCEVSVWMDEMRCQISGGFLKLYPPFVPSIPAFAHPFFDLAAVSDPLLRSSSRLLLCPEFWISILIS